MSYQDDLSKGFLLTFPNSQNGIYLCRTLRCYAYVSEKWNEYSYLRIYKCRHCQKYFVIQFKTDIFIELNVSYRTPSSVALGKKCKDCKNIDYSKFDDDPESEYNVPINHSGAAGLKSLLRR